MRRPSLSFAASTALLHLNASEVGTVFMFACSQAARLAEVPRSKVEMIMKPKRPPSGSHDGFASEPDGTTVHGMSVISKVRSSPGGFARLCERSTYRQVPG